MKHAVSSFRVLPVFFLLLSQGAGAAGASEELMQLRDPFRRPDAPLRVNQELTGLEAISVDKFKMIGVATGPINIRAMLQDPNGRVYFVSENTKIGLRKGVITRITSDFVKVREKIVNVVGKEEDVFFEIRLPPTKGI